MRCCGGAAGMQREGQFVTALDPLAKEYGAHDNKDEDDAADRGDDREDAVEAHHQERAGSCLLYTLRAHETVLELVCRLLLEKKKCQMSRRNIVKETIDHAISNPACGVHT